MFRFTRPLRQVLKSTTGIHGLNVHPNPLPELIKTYESTLSTLTTIPQTSVYRQGVEALTRHKLNIAKTANGDVSAVEKQLNEGHIEESLDIASDELSLAAKMVEWKSCVIFPQLRRGYLAHFKIAAGNLWQRNQNLVNGNTLERQHHHNYSIVIVHHISRMQIQTLRSYNKDLNPRFLYKPKTKNIPSPQDPKNSLEAGFEPTR